MSWNAPMTFVAGQVLTADQLNRYLRDNLDECAPAKAGLPGGYFVTTGTNQIAQRKPRKHTILAVEQTASTSYVDLTTVGPTISLTTGTDALVIWGAQIMSDINNVSSFVSVTVSGATSIAATTDNALRIYNQLNRRTQMSQFCYYDNLNPGTNVFTMKYATGGAGATCTFDRRRMVIFPY